LRCQLAKLSFKQFSIRDNRTLDRYISAGVLSHRADEPQHAGKLEDTVMLNCYGEQPTNRGQLSRRDMLQVGSLSVVGLMLPDVLRLQAKAACLE
jgi:hypothetical protein